MSYLKREKRKVCRDQDKEIKALGLRVAFVEV